MLFVSLNNKKIDFIILIKLMTRQQKWIYNQQISHAEDILSLMNNLRGLHQGYKISPVSLKIYVFKNE